jgi:hypothetical protein
MVHRGGGQQGRDRHIVGVGVAVGQDQDVVSVRTACSASSQSAIQRRRHALGTLGGRVDHVQRLGAEGAAGVVLDVADALQVLVGQHRLVDLQTPVLAGLVETEQVRPRADQRHQRHDQLLADRVDGRVGDLGEVLLEVGRQVLGARREHRRRVVRPHGADRLLAGQHHRRQQELDVLLAVAEGLLASSRTSSSGRHGRDVGGQGVQVDLGAIQPLAVGLGVGELGLDLGVVDDAALLQVDQEHLAGLQAPLLDDRSSSGCPARPSRRP